MVHGFVLVDKPVGPSSHTAVQIVRRSLGISGRRGTKAGHAGTLDPFASGLLLVLVGRATRLMPFVVGHDKRYLVDVRFGASSDTDDSTGTLTPAVGATGSPAEDDVRSACAQLAASTTQVPPAVSAIHIDGERAYTRVRRGEVVQVPPRPVRFDVLDVVEWHAAALGDTGPRVVLDVRCSTGTYMRALARDLGELVGAPAHCEALRRLEVGEFALGSAPSPAEVELHHVRDAAELVRELPQVVLETDASVLDVVQGRRIASAGLRGPDGAPLGALEPGSPTVLLGPDGSLVALAEVTAAADLLQPRTVLVGG